MVKVVFDTNVLVSAMLSNRGSSYKLVSLCAQGEFTGYTSGALMLEFKQVIQRDFKVPIERAEQMVDVFLLFLKLVEPDVRLNVITDEADNRVLECALAVSADYISSWDPHLTDLGEYQKTRILNPGKLLAIIA
ncbi:MAG: putative toxin-antitoxin system toxin component, PIN family [Candidatus Micrarchaeota archaeon]